MPISSDLLKDLVKQFSIVAKEINDKKYEFTHIKFETEQKSSKELKRLLSGFVSQPSEDKFKEMWNTNYIWSANMKGNATNILNRNNFETIKDVLKEIHEKDVYDVQWEEKIGARSTLREFWGKVKDQPVQNGCANNGLKYFGYSKLRDYPSFNEEFEKFSQDYLEILGGKQASEYPLHTEIDQLFNFLDKARLNDTDAEDVVENSSLMKLYELGFQIRIENEIESEKITQLIDPYIKSRNSGDESSWNEKYKWKILPELSPKFVEGGFNSGNIAGKMELIQKANPQEGSFTHWSSVDSLLKIAKNNPDKLAQLINILFDESSNLSLIERVNTFNEETKTLNENKSLGTPLIGLLLAAYDYNKYPLYKDEVYRKVGDIIGDGEEWKGNDIGKKYYIFTVISRLMGEELKNSELKDIEIDGVKIPVGYTALDGQDFFFHTMEHIYKIIDPRDPGGDEPMPKVYKFKGFTKESFENLEKLAKDTSFEVVKKISNDISNTVVYPLRDLLLDIGNSLDSKDILSLEKQKGLTSRLFKPNPLYGAYSYIWGAFYDKGKRKLTSLQFYIFVDKDELSYGFYQGEWKNTVSELLIKNLETYGDQLKNYLPESFYDEFLFQSSADLKESTKSYDKITNFMDIKTDLEKGPLSIKKILTREQVIKIGINLVDIIYKDFEKLVPLYAFGISNKPIELLKNYYGDEEDVEVETGPTREEVLADIFMESVTFDEITSLLESDKKQVILQGPPGTGKTYVGQKMAQYLAQSDLRVEVIQFHPSYAYEDFIEGFRPSANEGFELQDGIFKEFCAKAKANPEKKFVLIIDEINRGDLAKVFGELMFLLEYRHKEAKLAYSKKLFRIPENVYIIGTMNTADRSLAIMDYALRRRFYFVNLPPNLERLKEWLVDNNCQVDVEDLIKKIENANNEIAQLMHSQDYAIGHSFFMRKNLSEDGVKEIIKYNIKPLLSEYFVDRNDQAEKIIELFLSYEP